MRSVLLAVAAAACVEFTAAIAGYLLPASKGEWPIDTFFKGATWAVQADRVVLGTGQLAKVSRPSLFVLGASGAQEAYRPGDLAKLLPGYDVHNLSIGGSNITQLSEVLDHIIKSTPQTVLANSTLVVAVIYAVFVDDDTRWSKAITPEEAEANMPGVSDLERASRACSFVCSVHGLGFKLAPAGFVSLVKDDYRLLRRVRDALNDEGARLLTGLALVDEFIHPGSPPKSFSSKAFIPAPTEAVIEEQQRAAIAWLHNYMGAKPHLLSEQFNKLAQLMRKARLAGMRVVVVDMPLPSWHRAGTPYDTQGRDLLHAAIARLNDPFVQLIELNGAVPDTDFRDSAHPRPERAPSWSHELIDQMNIARQSP